MVMAQWLFIEWLLIWLLETSIFELDWDRGNSTKSARKHGVSTTEVEEVFRLGLALPLGEQISPSSPEQRLGIVGPTNRGRLLMVAFVLREGRVRPISARPAHRKERKQYASLLRQIAQSLR